MSHLDDGRMNEWIIAHFETILSFAAVGTLLILYFRWKWNEAKNYQEIRSGNVVSGINVTRDFATLRGRGFDCRLKTSSGGPRGGFRGGNFQNTQTLLIRTDQLPAAMKALSESKDSIQTGYTTPD